MNEREKTDELLRQMGEVHRRHEGSVDENTLLLRALEGRKPGRLLLSLLMGLLPPLLFFAVIIQPWWPVLGSKAYSLYNPVSWTVAGVQVSPYRSEDVVPNSPFADYGAVYYTCSTGEVHFTIAELPAPLEGSEFAAAYRDTNDGRIYLLRPSNEVFVDPTPYTQMQPRISPVTETASQMLKAKLWPSRLWRLKPFVRKLAANKFRLVRAGPYKQRIEPAELFVGTERMQFLEGWDLSGANSRVKLEVTMWPDRFTVSTPFMTLVGNDSGYVAYQEDREWGSSVDFLISAIKGSLGDYYLQLSTCEPGVSSEYVKRIAEVTKQVQETEPESLLRVSDSVAIRALLEPWAYEGLYYGDLQERYLKVRKSLGAVKKQLSEKPVRVAGTLFERGKGMYGLAITRGATTMSFDFGWAQTEVKVEKDGMAVCLLDVHNYYSYPALEHTFDVATEGVLSDVADIASDILAASVDSLPGDQTAAHLLRQWLEALATRSFLLKTAPPASYLNTEIEHEGDRAVFVMSVGELWETDAVMDLLIEPDGFQVFNHASASLLMSRDGQLLLERSSEATQVVFTEASLRQMRGCLAILDSALPYVGVPLDAGKEALRLFLADPELPEPEIVKELPQLEWTWPARIERDRSCYPPNF